MTDKPNIQANKDVAKDFLQLVVTGQIDEAYAKYVDMQGKHHNMYFPSGFLALKQAMIDDHAQVPNKEFAIKQIIGDGNIVAAHSHIVMEPGKPGYAVVHIFRFIENKIVEMWDLAQEIPDDSPNQSGAF